MRELTPEEFSDRMLAIQRARHIFIETGLTDNITHAFQAYQSIFAERERQIFLAINQDNRYKSPMDKFERPLCPTCGSNMRFRQLPENEQGYKMQLICSNGQCDVVLNDTHDLQWWMDNLKVKNGYSIVS